MTTHRVFFRWARQRWLSPTSSPKANVAKLGYYADYWAALQGDRLKATPGLPEVANHDYFVSQKAFFFDLSVWVRETAFSVSLTVETFSSRCALVSLPLIKARMICFRPKTQ